MANKELIGVCTECRSDQRDSYMEKNPFYQQGGSVPCQFCGGVVIVVRRDQRDSTLRRLNERRGINKGS